MRVVCQFAENPLLIKAAPKTVCQHKNLILLAWHDRCPIVTFQPQQSRRLLADRAHFGTVVASSHFPHGGIVASFADRLSDRASAW